MKKKLFEFCTRLYWNGNKLNKLPLKKNSNRKLIQPQDDANPTRWAPWNTHMHAQLSNENVTWEKESDAIPCWRRFRDRSKYRHESINSSDWLISFSDLKFGWNTFGVRFLNGNQTLIAKYSNTRGYQEKSEKKNNTFFEWNQTLRKLESYETWELLSLSVCVLWIG